MRDFCGKEIRIFISVVVLLIVGFSQYSIPISYAGYLGEPCGDATPGHQGQCATSCACPNTTRGFVGVCAPNLECCSPGYAGNPDNYKCTGGQAPATGGGAGGGAVAPPPVANTAGDPPGASCVDGNITGQCAAPLAGATIGDCTNIGSSVSSTTCASHFCCLKTGVSCKAKGGVCQTKSTACANFVSGGNAVCSNLCSAGYTASGPDDCNLSTNPNNAQCCMPIHNIVSVHAHLVGTGHGQNADGTAENANPQNKTATMSFFLANAPTVTHGVNIAKTSTGIITYATTTGLYGNPKILLSPLLATGRYQIIAHVDRYLDAQVFQPDNTTVAFTIPAKNVMQTHEITLVPGDIAPASPGDNIIDIQDYNTMVSCMSGNSAICSNPVVMADLNDDGVVDQKDLDLLESNFGSLGASFKIPKFMCEQDPSCGKGSSSLQLCPLQCKIQNIRE